MSMEMMKKAALGVAGALALATASVSQAQLSPANVAGTWQTLQPGPGTYTFSGQTELSASGITPTCNLSLTGDVTYDPAGDLIEIVVTGGSVTAGSFTCYFIDLAAFPWTAYADSTATSRGIPGSQSPAAAAALDPVPGEFRGVVVELSGTPICSGPVQAEFQNGTSSVSDDSFFTFNSSIGSSGCSVTTIDPTGLSANNDVNAW